MSKTIERRAFSARIETRDNGDGTVGIRGYAAVFNAEAHGEVIKPAAFNRTLKQRDNVRLLVNHDGVPLASTKAGTMTLSVDKRGLVVDVPSLDMSNPTAAELVSAMSRGDIDQMSFGFIAHDTPVVDGIRELREVGLVDVSVVTFPWYEVTSVGLTGDRESDRALVQMRSLTADQQRTVLDYLSKETRAVELVEATPADMAEDMIEEAVEASMIDQAVALIRQVLASEAEELAEGEGSTQPIQILVQVLNLLDQFTSVDAADDAAHAADEMAAAMQPAEPAAPVRQFSIAEARQLLVSTTTA